MTDRARSGLVALYDIRPGNGAGQFLQPRSPHGAENYTRNAGTPPPCDGSVTVAVKVRVSQRITLPNVVVLGQTVWA